MAPTIPEIVSARNDRFVSVPLTSLNFSRHVPAYSRLMDQAPDEALGAHA